MRNRGYYSGFGGAYIPEILVATFDELEDAFEGDGEALRVLASMASGRSPRETQQEIGMDETRYASTLRRIRRRLRREFH